MDAVDCLPPQCEMVLEQPAGAVPSVTEEVMDEALAPVEAVVESITAATGWGLPLDYDEAAYAALPHRSLRVESLGGLAVTYVVAGDPAGRRVIFVHGAPGEASEWGRFLLDVPPGLEYVALDRPGYGGSGPEEASGDEPDDDLGTPAGVADDEAVAALRAQAEAVAALLETRGGKRPILVGYSYGGPVVMEVASLHQAEVGGALLIGGALDPDLEDPSLLQYVAQLSPIAELLPRDLDSANRELLALRAGIQSLRPLLAGIALPITLIHGTADSLVPVENVAYLQRHLTAADPLRVVLVEEADHFLPWSHYDLLRESLLELSAALDRLAR